MSKPGMQGSNMQMRKLGGASGAGVGDSGYNRNGQVVSPRQQYGHPKKFTYDTVNGRKVGKGWLEPRPGDPMPVEDYRRHLFAALQQAKDKYVQRQRQQGGVVPGAIAQQAPANQNLKTIDPAIPDFALKRNALYKFAGMCNKKQLTRFFTVDQGNFKYYTQEKDQDVKKSLELKDAEAFIQEQSAYYEQKNQGQTEKGDAWAEPNQLHRVGIKLRGRDMKPVYFYSKDLHDAKFLLVNIQVFGNPGQTAAMTGMIELAYQIEKVARFQKIMSLMCFAKEKRFVAMHGFQQLALDMIQIAQQSQEYRRMLTLKWFTNMLGEDEKPIIRSPFRSANPRMENSQRLEVTEQAINKHISRLQTFIKNRKINRQQAIAKEINRQLQEETTGILVQDLTMDVFNQEVRKYENVWSIHKGQGSLIFDSEESYKFMIIENKSLDPPNPAATSSQHSNIRKRQAQNLIRKINIGDISFISTDLDQTTQFDFNNKINKQASYRIRLYGRVNALGESKIEDADMAPSQLGLDVLRQSKPKYRISVNHIKFPPRLAEQVDKKITFFVKLYQFQNSATDQPNIFESTSQCVKIRGLKGAVYPHRSRDQANEPTVFNVDKLGSGGGENFAIGLVIRTNAKPIPLVTERYKEHVELKSHEQDQYFSYNDLDTEQHVKLGDRNDQFEITFSVSKIDPKSSQGVEISERQGKRLLVGKYVLYQGKPAYVRSLSGNAYIDIVETISKRERKVHVQNVSLLETHGVSVFKYDKEPQIVRTSRYDWILNLTVYDKRILNSIHRKIQIRQAYLAYKEQDTKTKDELSSIEGDMVVSLIETKGLIVPSEINRKNADQDKYPIDPVVEVRIERLSGAAFVPPRKPHFSEVVKEEYLKKMRMPRREVVWGRHGKASNGGIGEFVANLGTVNHSGLLQDDEVKVERSKRKVLVKKPAQANTRKVEPHDQEDKQFIHFVVRNNVDGQEIGDAKIELDELIDINLQDLAKEYCVCLNRSHVLDKVIQERILEGTKQGKTKESIMQEMSKYTRYSGIIRFQTLFQPTKDTSLRFQQARETSQFKSPKQLLHFEYLLEKSDFDQFKYKIPQIAYNPNIKNLGEDLLDLPNLIAQCEGNPKISKLLKRIQNQDGKEGSVRSTGVGRQEISEEIMKEIDRDIKFQSPFEKLYIILKLQRKERPFLEQVFFNFKSIWGIYTQVVKNQAFDSLNLNEWLSFIDELASKHNFDKLDEVFEQADDAESNQDMDKSEGGHTQKSVSFVGEMVKQMNRKAAGLKRQSTLMARGIESGATDSKNFSLVLCQEWEKEGNQSFIDLVNLIKCGIPTMLRTVVWGDLMKTNLIAIEEKKQMMKNYSKKYNKQLSTFDNFLEISQKYDSIVFRQIDQDISDFKFPAYYYEDSVDQNSAQSGYNVECDAHGSGNVNRINKLKHDKQLMRKLLRILLVWGKTFKSKGVNYQLCYPQGFLKVVHRFINLMSMEDAFWILIGFIRQYPRLWCLQESCMLDDAKSNFRFELTAFKAILEVNFPKITQKLYQVGLAVEVLVYESMTSLYCDYFHSDSLLRIWDQMIFYFNTTDQSSKRRGIWLLLAPALMIIAEKHQTIEEAQTAKEIIDAYKDGCGIDYNPNHLIEKLNDLIDDVFVTEGKQKERSNMSVVAFAGTSAITESGGTGSGGKEAKSMILGPGGEEKSAGFLSGFFGTAIGGKEKKIAQLGANPTKVDEVRRSYQQKQNVILEESRNLNQVVGDFLFKNSDEAIGQAKNSKDANKQHPGGNRANRPGRMDEDDEMDFAQNDQNSIDDGFGQANGGLKPASHQTLDYRHWRMDILPAIQSQFLMTDEIVDDDLHEFEDNNIYEKQDLDIKVLHIYLHNLESWFGTDDNGGDFRLQVQYGRLHSNGKFEVKSQSKDDAESKKSDSNLQYFCQFKYSQGYNHIKVKIMTAETEEKLCHCYVDLRGHQRGKFIYFQKTMNAKEYQKNAESQFSLTQLKMSLFLESKKEQTEEIQQNTEDEQSNKMTYLYSLKKYEPGRINIYRSAKEQNFQRVLLNSLQNVVQNDYQNFKQYLKQDVVIDILNYKYNFTEILPRTKFGHLDLQLFKNFVEKCMPEHANVISASEFNQIYKGFLSSKSNEETKNAKDSLIPNKQESSQNFVSRSAILDTEKPNEMSASQVLNMGKELLASSKGANIFSLRSFVFSVLFQSPITVKEKLDILYDITDMTNKFQDGIDMHDAHMIYETILRQHLYYMPSNELRTQVENVFNGGEISGIVGAYWTRKTADNLTSAEIKYDMDKSEASGFTSLEEFLASSQPGRNKGDLNAQQLQDSVIDITKEFQETFVMYQNLFGNKLLDFNEDTSPFKHFNNIFASTGKGDLGQILLQKTLSLGQAQSQKYRLCLVSQIAGGERVLTEIKYNLQDGSIIVDEEKQPNDKNKFKRFFMKNINVLDLSGKQRALGKQEFMAGTSKIPFVYDLMRAETFWQDRKLDQQPTDKQAKGSSSKMTSLKMKTRFSPVVNVFLSDKDKVFIFKFENRVMGGRTDQTQIKELVKDQIYMFEIEALYLEDIVLDMRDRIVTELSKVEERGMNLSDDFLSEIEGKMEFYVRKVSRPNAQGAAAKKPEMELNKESVAGNNKSWQWLWKNVNDFDRMEKFSDDEVFEDEVVFKLVKKQGADEEILDEKPQHILEGYDCFSLYKHSDDSYEWRLCKIVGKAMKPEYKQMAMEAFVDLAKKSRASVQDGDGNEQDPKQGGANRASVHDSDQYYYFLEFQHLKDYGREMWVKRRREDVIFSARYARDQPSFEESCHKFIQQAYRS